MGLYIQILLGVLVLASFVIAYFAARTWHWSHVLVMLGIFLSTVGYFVLAAETLRINAVLRKSFNEVQAEVATVEAQTIALRKGSREPQVMNQLRALEVRLPDDAETLRSMNELDHQLNLITRLRGRVWRNVGKVGFDPATGQLQIGVEAPAPAGFNKDSVVFLFEQGESALPDPTQGAQYLGEFRIRETAGQQASLEPVLRLDEFETGRIANSQGPWILYETMPMDRHEIFASMTEEEIRKLIPEASVQEYVRHGKEAVADDDEFHRAGYDESGKRVGPDEFDKAAKQVYERRLRDYALEFEQLSRHRAVLVAEISGVRQDVEKLAAAQESAKKLEAFRTDEVRRLTIDLAGVKKEREAIDRHLGLVQRQVARAQELLAQTIQQNSELAKELARQQAIDGAAVPAESMSPLALGAAN